MRTAHAAAMATTYTVSLLPDDHPDYDTYALTVEYRGVGAWAVMRHRWCLGKDGTWDLEPNPSSREDEWIADHRFGLDEAIALAKAAAPDVRVNHASAREVAEDAGRRRD